MVHVVRCFEDENVVHVDGSVDPVRDMETINLELVFADLETVERRIDRTKKMMKSGDKRPGRELEILEAIRAALEAGRPARTVPVDEEDAPFVKGLFLLTTKPVVYVANVAEDALGAAPDAMAARVYEAAAREGAEAMTVCAQLEEEVAALDPAEKAAFLAEMGVQESGLDQLVRACYRLLGLISFLTAGADEVRAWTIRRGWKAPQAAGVIHTDFERGFIRAEIVPYDTLVSLGSMAACREKGLVRSEGKDYVMQDGDVTLFRFNV